MAEHDIKAYSLSEKIWRKYKYSMSTAASNRLYIHKNIPTSATGRKQKLTSCYSEQRCEKDCINYDNSKSNNIYIIKLLDVTNVEKMKSVCFSDVFEKWTRKSWTLKQEKNEPLKEESNNGIAFFQMFRYATPLELFAIFGALVFALIAGLCPLCYLITYGEFSCLMTERSRAIPSTPATVVLKLFGGGKMIYNGTREQHLDALLDDSKAYAIAGCLFCVVQLISGALAVDLMNFAAIRQVARISTLMLRSILRQDITWFEKNSNNFAVRITDDIENMKEGMGEKVIVIVVPLSFCISGIITSFLYGWKFSLVVLCFWPIVLAVTIGLHQMQNTDSTKEYSLAGNVADEVIGSIKTVVAFGGEQKETERYMKQLRPADKANSRKGLLTGVSEAFRWLIVCCAYGVGVWYGVSLIIQDSDNEVKEFTGTSLITCIYTLIYGSQPLMMASPYLEPLGKATKSAAVIFPLLNRQSCIDSLSKNGKKINILGNLVFKDVYFQYPTRPEIKVLLELNLNIHHGETVVIFGESGCGKSTIIQLIQRLYDPSKGKVLLDGVDISELNVPWYRSHIGVVGQEPVLFRTSIKENIRYGKPDASDLDIIEAARSSNAHEFIVKLPNGYETLVGERGSQLSGGQKQCIGIARALIRGPKILLLDEATSALDYHTESAIRKSIDRTSKNRTTIIVTHRLSTIKKDDQIVFLEKGHIAELGTHSELMALKNLYYHLVIAEVQGDETVDDKDATLENFGTPHSDIDLDAYSDSVTTKEIEIVEESKKSTVPNNSMRRMMRMSSPEWAYIAVGCMASIVVGAGYPVNSLLYAELVNILADQTQNGLSRDSIILAIYFFILGILMGLASFLKIYLMRIADIRLTSRLRSKLFAAILRHELGWFDEDRNSVGALGARLSGDISSVEGITTSRLAAILQCISAILVGTAFSLFYTWKITLVAWSLIPVVIGAVMLEAKTIGGAGLQEKQATESATSLAVEAIINIRTVASLGQEMEIMDRFILEMKKATKMARIKARLRGIVYSMGQTVTFIGSTLAYSYGGTLVAKEGLPVINVFAVGGAIIFGASMMGFVMADIPNINDARVSASRIFCLLDRISKQTLVVPLAGSGLWKAKGDVEYKNIDFHYPTRPDVRILRGLNLQVRAGQNVALVGHSGCGKTTTVQLLLRLYDPIAGELVLDDYNISTDLSVINLRAQIGIVSQEPVLFDRTIGENIAYGDNSRTIPMEEIIKAAQTANIHAFIATLPLGYDTRLGQKGVQISGGQKQRIAIARALVRNPRILILDEATSSLDTQSQTVVQAALDKAKDGRTCIIIAHRLSTIQNADVICVFNEGRVVERGAHDQLLALGGIYTKLHALKSNHSLLGQNY